MKKIIRVYFDDVLDRRVLVDTARLIQNAEFLKDYKPTVEIMDYSESCKMREIRIGNMAFPEQNKLKRYRDYYAKYHNFAFPIVVDENNNIRDGYTTYIIASEEGVEADIIRIDSNVKYKKVVIGRHVVFDGENYISCSDKSYRWYCDLDEPVVPGDVLLANTRIGKRFMVVDRISYVAGNEACSRDKKVKKFIKAS